MVEMKRKPPKRRPAAAREKPQVKAEKPQVPLDQPRKFGGAQPGSGAPHGNHNARKFDTAEERQAAFQAYCFHIAAGFSSESFHTPCVDKTVKAMLAKYPDEFDLDALDRAKAIGRHVWEDIGMQGTIGKIPGFNATSWRVNMFNRLGWAERQEHGFDKDTRKVFKLAMGKKLGTPKDEDEDGN